MYIFKPRLGKGDLVLNQLSPSGDFVIENQVNEEEKISLQEIAETLISDPERELEIFEEWVYQETGYYPSEIKELKNERPRNYRQAR